MYADRRRASRGTRLPGGSAPPGRAAPAAPQPYAAVPTASATAGSSTIAAALKPSATAQLAPQQPGPGHRRRQQVAQRGPARLRGHRVAAEQRHRHHQQEARRDEQAGRREVAPGGGGRVDQRDAAVVAGLPSGVPPIANGGHQDERQRAPSTAAHHQRAAPRSCRRASTRSGRVRPRRGSRARVRPRRWAWRRRAERARAHAEPPIRVRKASSRRRCGPTRSTGTSSRTSSASSCAAVGAVEPDEQPVLGAARAEPTPGSAADLRPPAPRRPVAVAPTSSGVARADDLGDRARLDEPAPVHDHQVRAGLLDLGQQVAGDDDGPAARPRTGSSPRASRGSAAGRGRWSARRGSAGRAGRAWPARWRAAAACPASTCAPRGPARRRGPAISSASLEVGVLGGAAGGLPVQLQVGPARSGAAGSRRPRRRRRPGTAPARRGGSACPKTRISPASGRIRPISMRRVVVLPAPFGPEQAEHLALLDPEGQVPHRVAVARTCAYRLLRPVICSGTSASCRGRARRACAVAAPAGQQQRGGDSSAGGRQPPDPRGQPAAAAVPHAGRGGHGQAAVRERDGVRGGRGRGGVAEVGGGERRAAAGGPAANSWSTAGSVSVDRAAAPRRRSTRTGATSWAGRPAACRPARRRRPCRRAPRRPRRTLTVHA